MPDQVDRFEENVPGEYYVTKVCIGCALCSEIAPDNFMENADEESAVGNSYVYKQPQDEAETLLCKEAMETCPADAICNNGNIVINIEGGGREANCQYQPRKQ